MIHTSRILKSSTLVQVWDDSQASRDKVTALLKNIEANGHVKLQALESTLLDYMTGAPSRNLVIAIGDDKRVIGALAFVDGKDEQEITSLGTVTGDTLAKALIRALDRNKAWSVSAFEPNQPLYQALGFRHSEEFEAGEPSKMIKYPAGHTATFKQGDSSANPWVKPGHVAASDLLQRAEAFARRFHASVVNADGSIGQKRKYTGEDYIIHPIAVSKILAEHGHDELVQAAALLHDVVEDTDATLEDVQAEFGPEIAEIVRQATHIATKEDGNRAKRKEIDREHYQTGDERGQSLKLADLLHNLSDIVPYDRNFAKVWVPEAEALAQGLTKGNPVLRAKVLDKIAEAKKELGLKKASSESTLVLWHGGNLEGPLEEFPNQKGSRSWYGPGLYLTTQWDTAQKYSKGSRKLYRITISKGNDANETCIPTEEAIKFVKTYIAKARQSETIESLQKFPHLRAAWFLSILLNIGKIRPGYTGILRQFLVEQGVDYEIVDNAFGWGERMVVLFNMSKIIKKEIIGPKAKIDEFDLPKDWKETADSDNSYKTSSIETSTTKVAGMLKVSRILKKANDVWDSVPEVSRQHYKEQHSEKAELQEDIKQFAKDYMAKNGLSQYSITDLFHKPELKVHSYRLLSALEKALSQNNLLAKVRQLFGEKITDWFYSGKIAARISDPTQVFYHGTPSEDKAKAIMTGGIQPRDMQDPNYAGRGWMAPPKGRVYISPSLAYAAIYALGGDMFGSSRCKDEAGYGYIFEIPGDSLEGDVQPDEDSIGEAVHDAMLYTQAEKRMNALKNGASPKSASEMESLQRVLDIQGKSPINNPSNESIRLSLVDLANRVLSDPQRKRICQGLYAEWARSGKKLQKVLPESISEALLSWGAHVSHQGVIFPLKAWKFKKKDAANIQSSEILSICKEIPLRSQGKKVAHIDLVEAFCVNKDCADYQKKGAGNLTQEFSYGVNHDRFMLYCKTCKKRFSETQCSEFFGAKISSDDIIDILEKASDGMSVRDIADELGLNKDTVNQTINKAKEICEEYVGDGPKQVTNEMLGDLNLPLKEKSSVRGFITDVVVPRMKADK